MDACPACTASLKRNGHLHCTSPTCTWIKCKTCGVTIDTDTTNYWDERNRIWGDQDGHLKATG